MEVSIIITNEIIISGAKEKNLKNVSVSIPKSKITSVVGVSGYGKSALVFDTIAAAILYAIRQQVHLAVSYSAIVSQINLTPLKKSQSVRLSELISAKEKERDELENSLDIENPFLATFRKYDNIDKLTEKISDMSR